MNFRFIIWHTCHLIVTDLWLINKQPSEQRDHSETHETRIACSEQWWKKYLTFVKGGYALWMAIQPCFFRHVKLPVWGGLKCQRGSICTFAIEQCGLTATCLPSEFRAARHSWTRVPMPWSNLFCGLQYVILKYNSFTVDMYLTSVKPLFFFLYIECIRSLKWKGQLSSVTKKQKQNSFSLFIWKQFEMSHFQKWKGVFTGMSISKYFLCSYLMLTNYMLLMADIMEPVRNVPLWLWMARIIIPLWKNIWLGRAC